MPEVSTQITIKAPREKVWETLTAFHKYGEWNKGLRVEMPLQIGAAGAVKVRAPGLPPFGSPIKLEKMTRPKELAWKGNLPGLAFVMRGYHWFRLEEKDGKTVLHHGEEFGGFLATLLWPLMGSRLAAAYQQMNEALKQRCESGE